MADDDDDWDAEDFAPPVLGGPPKPPEAWSDEEEDEVKKVEQPAAPTAAAAPAPKAADEPLRPKQLAKAKLAEREAKEQQAQEACAKAAAAAAKSARAFGDDRGLLDGARSTQESGETDALAEKLRLRKLQEEADFENAQGIFDMSRSKKPTAVPGAETTIDAFVARTAADGEQLADKMAQKLQQFENTPFYLSMLKSLIKHASANMGADDVKELSTSVQVIANDKLKAERERQKGKKKPTAASKKASLAQSHNPAFDNTDEYGNFGDDDFM